MCATPFRVGRSPCVFTRSDMTYASPCVGPRLGGLGGLVARRELGEDGVEGDGGGGDSRGRAGLGHRLVAVWARVRAAFGDG